MKLNKVVAIPAIALAIASNWETAEGELGLS
jgi:hypothetical protein